MEDELKQKTDCVCEKSRKRHAKKKEKKAASSPVEDHLSKGPTTNSNVVSKLCQIPQPINEWHCRLL